MPTKTATSRDHVERPQDTAAPTTESVFADLKVAAEKGRKDRGTSTQK
jgi:hypothetical protein